MKNYPFLGWLPININSEKIFKDYELLDKK
jgi:hypothetical protein